MTTKYSIDSESWLRSNARLYERNGMQQTAMNLTIIADEIAALRARVARLEDALREIATLYWVDAPAPEEMRRIARRALEEK